MALTVKVSGTFAVTDSVTNVTMPFGINDTNAAYYHPVKQVVLAPSQANVDVDFCDLTTAKYVLLTTDNKDFQVKVNSNTENVTYNGVALFSGSFTSLKLSNPNSVSVTVTVLMAGV
jgi:hypothetical protein